MHPKYRNFLLFLLLLSFGFVSNQVLAQNTKNIENISDDQISSFLEQAQRSGMSQAQIEAAALAKGYSPEMISTIKERANGLKNGNTRLDTKMPDSKRKQLDEDGKEIIDADEEPLLKKSIATNKKDSIPLILSKIFGASIFQNKKLSFEPNLRLPTPKNYILGPDDELNIDITGYAYKHYTVKVSTEGSVNIENLSPIYISGSTIEQAKERITNRLKTIFAGLNANGGNLSADITLGNVRSVHVMLIGEVFHPGTYTLSSLATAFNALYACGGVTDKGTLRDIEVYRNGRIIRKIDIYDFLLRGDQHDNILLNDQDIIRVPYYETRIELIGEIKSPLIFEIKRGETFKNVLDFAGGFTEEAYSKSINVVRITATERKMLTIQQSEFAGFIPQKGDKFIVGKVSNRFENKVSIRGAVLREGDYALEKGMTLSQLIHKAEGLREDAFLNRALLIRERENLDPEIINLDLKKILQKEEPDIELKKQDSIVVKSYSDLREKRVVNIDGAVNKVGAYPFLENMTVGDLIALTGGFSDGASSSRIEIARRVKEDTVGLAIGQNIRIITLNISRDLKLSQADEQLVLQPFDKVSVRKLAHYEEQKNVAITGEVLYGGSYALQDKKARISDLIEKAGGLKAEADLKAAKFTRDKKIVSVNLTEILKDNSNENNLLLNSGDGLEIPRKKETVAINGQVMNPITVAYQSKLHIRDYIDRAGGGTDSARLIKTYVRYANGTIERTRSFLFFPVFPKAEQGMEIIVPTRRKGTHLTMAERLALGSGLTTLGTAIILLLNYLKK